MIELLPFCGVFLSGMIVGTLIGNFAYSRRSRGSAGLEITEHHRAEMATRGYRRLCEKRGEAEKHLRAACDALDINIGQEP